MKYLYYIIPLFLLFSCAGGYKNSENTTETTEQLMLVEDEIVGNADMAEAPAEEPADRVPSPKKPQAKTWKRSNQTVNNVTLFGGQVN